MSLNNQKLSQNKVNGSDISFAYFFPSMPKADYTDYKIPFTHLLSQDTPSNFTHKLGNDLTLGL